MPLLRIPPTLPSAAPKIEPKPSTALKTIGVRLPPIEVKAVETAAQTAGQTCSEWMREAVILHLKRPTRRKKTVPDATLLAEILGLRSLVHNLLVAASDIPETTVAQIVKHADAIKDAKAEEILRRLEGHPEEK